jgi:hypothetical protein
VTRIRIGLAVVALVLVGCAPVPPTPAPVPPASAARPAGTVPARQTTSAAAPSGVVPADSTPTAAALLVLGSIPEPLKPAERVPPLAPPATPSPVPAPDSEAVDTAGADVPVPEPTQPLGERHHDVVDASGAAGATTGAAATPAGAALAAGSASAAAATASDTCWRVQVLAPLEPEPAEQARATASSLLLVTVVVEQEQGRYKVRTKECLTRSAADLLRRRAVESGFTQAFRISGTKR